MRPHDATVSRSPTMTSHTRLERGLAKPRARAILGRMSPRPSSLPLGVLLAAACGPAPASHCPEPAVAAPPAEAPRAPDPDPGPASAPPAPARAGVRPTADFPIASACQAPLALTAEVTRLLTASAVHGTRSQSCVDGPGHRLAVNDVLVCPAGTEGTQTVVQAFYQVVTYPEGDTRLCSANGGCDWMNPTASEHLVELHLLPTGADPRTVQLVDLPDALPGFADATPLDQPHDGSCYGPSPAFVPAPVTLP